MRKWGIEDWIFMVLIAIVTGIFGTWYFGRELQAGFSQLVGIAISGTTLGMVTAIRRETIRWQDSHMRRIDNSDKVIDYYNDKVREPVIAFMAAFDGVMATDLEGNEDPQWAVNVSNQLGLPKILHLVDKIAWLLEQNSYLEKDDVLAAISSELARLLIAEKYQIVITQTLEDSSLAYVDKLIINLKVVNDHDQQK